MDTALRTLEDEPLKGRKITLEKVGDILIALVARLNA